MHPATPFQGTPGAFNQIDLIFTNNISYHQRLVFWSPLLPRLVAPQKEAPQATKNNQKFQKRG